MKRRLATRLHLTVDRRSAQPALAASLPLVTTQPDPPADVAPYFVGDTDLRWTSPNGPPMTSRRSSKRSNTSSSSSTRTARSTTNTARFPGVNGLYSDGKNPRAPPIRPASPRATSIRIPARRSPSSRSASGPSRTRRSWTASTIPIPAWPRRSTWSTASPQDGQVRRRRWRRFAARAAPRTKRWAPSSPAW